MVEGQEDVTWEQWLALANACEDTGLEGLFRSDHYLSVGGRPDRGSLDAWVTLAALAAVTERIRIGTMVSPVTFRHPSVLAKSVVTVDHVSGGRAELGMGAGWHEAEHRSDGFPFPETAERIAVLEEQLELVHRQWTEEEVDFRGNHFQVEGLRALPKPLQRPHPNLIVGGAAGRRSAALAARWADEYNTIFASPKECARRRAVVAGAWEDAGRDPNTLTFSLMTGCVIGSDAADVARRARHVMASNGADGSVSDWLDGQRDEWVVGTVDEARTRLQELEAAGVQRVMLQHQAHEDVEMVELLGREVAPATR